jgi:hypothetical protein
MGICLANIGSIMMQMGDYVQAIKYYKQSEESLKSIIFNQQQALSFNDDLSVLHI